MAPEPEPGVPRHEQISSYLRGEIEADRLNSGDKLPSEKALCKKFGVSRITVRRALQTLEADGLIFRRQGLGSFVSERPLAQGLIRLTDFAQDMARAGLDATSRVLRHEEVRCPGPVAERLGVEPGESVVRLDRLRLGEGTPVALDRTWLPLKYGRLLHGHDLAEDTLYAILEREYDIPVLSGRYRISAVEADEEVAAALSVDPASALLFIERTSRTEGGRPVYFQRRFYRPDRVAYELELARDTDESAGSEEEEGLPLREFQAVFRTPSD